MKLTFIINEYQLAIAIFYHLAKRKTLKYPSYWKKLENVAWKKFKNKPAFYFFYPLHLDWAWQAILLESSYKNQSLKSQRLTNEINEVFEFIFKTSEFKQTLRETQKYLNAVKKQWERNEKFVFQYFKDVLKLKSNIIGATVIIMHPMLYQGRTFLKEKTIIYGHKEDWENYATIYIAHELLHILMDNKCNNLDVTHVLIELATDNELRIRLNKRGKYFTENGHKIGHRNLANLGKKLLPFWKRFLADSAYSNINILTLEDGLVKKIPSAQD